LHYYASIFEGAKMNLERMGVEINRFKPCSESILVEANSSRIVRVANFVHAQLIVISGPAADIFEAALPESVHAQMAIHDKY
jgi:hypothetical protein